MKAYFITLALIFLSLAPAQAHDWYTNRTDPVTNSRCCGGTDCKPVPLDADWIRPTATGLRVVMSLEETRLINPNSAAAIDEVVPWSRVQSPTRDTEGVAALYHLCIAAYPITGSTRIFCIFAVPGL